MPKVDGVFNYRKGIRPVRWIGPNYRVRNNRKWKTGFFRRLCGGSLLEILDFHLQNHLIETVRSIYFQVQLPAAGQNLQPTQIRYEMNR